MVQAALLERGAALTRPGGRLAYVTCSILAGENGAQIGAFLDRRPDFRPIPLKTVWPERLGGLPADDDVFGDHGSVQLGPHMSATDGFFLALLERAA